MKQLKINKHKLGEMGENAAVNYLIQNKYKIIKRYYRIGRIGEIDIIAQKDEYICFIEVKARSNMMFGSPGESVNARKQQTIRRLASIFMQNSEYCKNYMRFDIVEIIIDIKNDGIVIKNINIIENAF